MEIFFCDVCCSRVTDSHLKRGQGIRKSDVVVCGSCLEKGHGSDLLKQAQSQRILVGAAPNLAGSGVLDGLRDRASTQRSMTVEDNESEIKTPEDEEGHSEEGVAVEDVIGEFPVEAPVVVPVEVPAEKENTASGSESGLNLQAVDLGSESADIELEEGSAEDLFQEESFDSPEVAVVDISQLDDETSENDIQKPETSSISVDDVIDDLMDEAEDERSESNILDDADDDIHTDSYSADELAAIKRLAENEKKKKQSSQPEGAADTRRSSGHRKAKTSGRRATASGRSPAVSGRKSTSTRASRKTTTKTKKLGPGGLPMPVFVSMITIPLILLVFLLFAPSGSRGATDGGGGRYDANPNGMTRLIRDARKTTVAGVNDNDLAKIKKGLGLIRKLQNQIDAFTAERRADGWDEDAVGRWLRKHKYHDLIGGIRKTAVDAKFLLEN